MNSLIATITYCLSEEGRERVVKMGGSGAYHRNVSGPVASVDARLFEVGPDGYASRLQRDGVRRPSVL